MIKVVLVGYMGSGKSVIGQLLSEKTGNLFIDLDQVIEQHENSTIKNIFETKGEIYFRKIEHQLFTNLLQSNDSFILSTGGGTPCYANNHELLIGDDIISVYLKASIDTLYNRLQSEKEKRPLLMTKSNDELKEFIAKHLFERSYFYNKVKHIIQTDDKSVHNIVNEIISLNI